MITERRPPDWEHRFTCKGCGAILKGDFSDIKFGEWSIGHASRPYMKCPYCHEYHNFERDDLPPYVVRLAIARIKDIEESTRTFLSVDKEYPEYPDE